MNFDTLVRTNPTLGFAVYYMEPGDPVTLEVHDGNNVYTFKAATLAEAIEKAFPSVVPQPPSSGESAFPSRPTREAPEDIGAKMGGGAETTGSVFD